MDPIVLTTDPSLQKVVRFHDLNDGQFAVDTIYDVEPILDENERVRNAQPDGWKGREHLVASIPMPLWQAMQSTWRQLGFSREQRDACLKQFLNDPANSRFRTKRGRL